ncbi:MAG: MarR family transcriptional regulator [Acutalibacteraceae bacterium]
MKESVIMPNENNSSELTNELIYRKYLMNNEQRRQFFKDLNMPEYIAMHIITETASKETIYSGRTYLKDISDKMQISIRQTSKIVANLRDRGLVQWAHDGNGSDGTYVIITDSGKQLMEKQETMLKDYYGRVIDKFGIKKMIQLLQMMKELETVMSTELEETEEMTDANE